MSKNQLREHLDSAIWWVCTIVTYAAIGVMLASAF